MISLLSIIKEIEKITFGAKITGAGDGGCIIALTKKDNDLSEYDKHNKISNPSRYQYKIQECRFLTPRTDCKNMILIKLGGSIITNKAKTTFTKKKNHRQYFKRNWKNQRT